MFNKNKKPKLEENKQFDDLAKDWWNKDGPFKLLHNYNAIRLPYIKKVINTNFNKNNNFSQIHILDIGCGGGLISEELSKNKASVIGIDTSHEAIKIAKLHSKNSNLDITYLNQDISEFVSKNKFDVILILEILEHVNNLKTFISYISNHLNTNGIIIFSTINRNLKSLLLAKFAAEYILKWVPKGIHDYKKFIKPLELEQLFLSHNLSIKDLKGVNYNIFFKDWEINNIPSINYIGYAKKI